MLAVWGQTIRIKICHVCGYGILTPGHDVEDRTREDRKTMKEEKDS